MSAETEAINTTVDAVDENASTLAIQAARAARLNSLRRNHVLTAMGVGLVPVPLVDLVGVMGVGVDLIKKLSNEYGDQQYDAEKVRSLLAALLAGALPIAVGGVLMSVFRAIPLIGPAAGAVTMPVLFGASMYAVHNVFVEHYERGGTILDFDPPKFKKRFKEEFTSGKVHASGLTETDTGVSA